MKYPVVESEIHIKSKDGDIDGYIYHDENHTPRPGIALYTDIRGIRQANRDMASRLAGDGFTVVLPNVFYRTGVPPIMAPDIDSDALRKRFGELRTPFTPAAIESDVKSYVEFLSNHNAVVKGPLGAVGYCFTGALAMFSAAIAPDLISAAASFHGGGLYTDQPDSPHLALPNVKARMYFGHAFEDGSMPADSITKLEGALKTWGGAFESEVYEAAGHGWTVPDSKAYNETEAEKAYAKLLTLFKEVLI